MNKQLARVISNYLSTLNTFRCAAYSSHSNTEHYKAVVVGGGSGGISIASKLGKKLGNVAIIEPAQWHYYQPMWTLVGSGLKTIEQSQRPMKDVIPSSCAWLQDKATSFDPQQNSVTISSGKVISYDYLILAMGVILRFDKIKGATEALENADNVCSNYHRKYVMKTHKAIQNVQAGNAIFTFPQGPIKCAGAPQKILYLAEEILREKHKNGSVNFIYHTALPVVFGVPKYAKALGEIMKQRDIQLNLQSNLVEVDYMNNTAIFQDLTNNNTSKVNYSLLHVSPPCSAPAELVSSSLVDGSGFVDVDKGTLQHNKYSNVFAIGDCSNVPTSKTAAAVAGQVGVLASTINSVINNKQPSKLYDGYTSCPLVTAHNTCILAEFGYDAKVMETFPFNQAKERKLMYFLKAHMMPELYWKGLLKGYWNGPSIVRKLLRLGFA